MIFRHIQAFWRIIVIRPVFLYCSRQLMLRLSLSGLLGLLVVVHLGCLYSSFYIQGGEVTRKVTESITT
jgi:hypothetical protein